MNKTYIKHFDIIDAKKEYAAGKNVTEFLRSQKMSISTRLKS